MSGLDKILISAYDGEEDVIKFQNMIDECNLNSDQYIIRDRSLPEEKNFGIALSGVLFDPLAREYYLGVLKIH